MINWFKKPITKDKVSLRVGETDIADVMWVSKTDNGVVASRFDTTGEPFIRLSIHKSEVEKRFQSSRAVKELKWKVSNGTFKTFTARTRSKYYQVFVLDNTTCHLLVSTNEFFEPPSKPIVGHHIYLSTTLRNDSVAAVLDKAETLHRNEITQELSEVS